MSRPLRIKITSDTISPRSASVTIGDIDVTEHVESISLSMSANQANRVTVVFVTAVEIDVMADVEAVTE